MASSDPYKDKNQDEPGTAQKIEDLSTFVKSSKFGMLTTRSGELLASRAMAVAGQVCSEIFHDHNIHLPFLPLLYSPLDALASSVQRPFPNPFWPQRQEADGLDLIFHTNNQSGKTDDLSSDPHVNVSFINASGEWASISGVASVINDRSVVAKYYSPQLKAWLGDLGDGKHDGSENDPRIGVIKVEAKTATYALAKGTMVGRAIEVVKGAVTGETANVNKLREISEQEIKQHRGK
jgi:general stress protein 26